MTTSYAIRVSQVLVGVSSGNAFAWTGIKGLTGLITTERFEHLEPPTGSTVIHQALHPEHIHFELVCEDLSALSTMLYNTVIDGNGHTVIDSNGEKWTIGYFEIDIVTTSNNIIQFIMGNVKFARLSLGEAVEMGKEPMWIIEFTADWLNMVGV